MPDVRRRWKYEKDVFGRKHRKYYLENVFGADVFDMKTFRALRVKMSRDYLQFFRELSKRYERGEFKKVAQEAHGIARSVVSLLDGMIESGTIDKKDVDEIVEMVDFLNEQRTLIVEKSEGVKALRGRLTNIEEETGISPESLSVSEKVIRRGAKREAQKRREGVLPFLKRTMPRTMRLGGEVFGGLGAAVAGPFGPLAGMIGGVGGDILGLGRGLFQKFGERRERRLGRMLAPLAGQGGRVSPLLGGLARRGGVGSAAAREAGKKQGANVLMEFFNRGAYKAKWTRELLKRTKGKEGRGLLGGLADKFKGLGLAIAPLLGTAGKIALLVGAIGLATDRINTLLGKFGEYNEVKKAVESEIKKQKQLQREQKERLQAALGEKLRTAVKEGDEVKRREALGMIKTVEQERAAKQEKESVTFLEKAVTWPLDIFKKEPKVVPPALPGGGKRIPNPTVPGSARTAPAGAVEERNALLDAIKKLNDSAAVLSRSTEKLRGSGQIREPGIGNPWDSSDPWINGLASSEISLED